MKDVGIILSFENVADIIYVEYRQSSIFAVDRNCVNRGYIKY